MIVRSIRKTAEFGKVVRTIEISMGSAIKGAYLAGYDKKLGSLTIFFCNNSRLIAFSSIVWIEFKFENPA